MPGAQDEEFGEDFASDVAADIGAELFSKGVSSPEEKPAGETPPEPVVPVEEKPAAPVETPNPAVVQGQNSVARPLPKSWKKDMGPVWEKLPPEAHEYVYAREADVMRGIQSYQQGHQQWTNLVQPFAPIFQQNPDVNPVQLMQGLMNTHLQLLNPSLPADRKLQIAQQIMQDYGIDLSGAQPQPQDQRLQQELQTLRQELIGLKQGFTAQQKSVYDQGVAEQQKIVDAFAAKNEHFHELGADIHQLIAKGVANDLQSAYDMACWANPTVRAKMLAKQQATAPAEVKRNGRGQFVNLETAETPSLRTRKGGTMDDTINSIVASHFSKH